MPGGGAIGGGMPAVGIGGGMPAVGIGIGSAAPQLRQNCSPATPSVPHVAQDAMAASPFAGTRASSPDAANDREARSALGYISGGIGKDWGWSMNGSRRTRAAHLGVSQP